MKLFSGGIAILCALSIASVAGFFSIVGMTSLFAAVFWPVVVMMGVLEISKLVAAGWLHANWRNRNVSIVHKSYLCLAIAALMLITAIGIYGYLAKGFTAQQTPLTTVGLQIAAKQQQIAVDQTNIDQLNLRQAQLDAAVNSLIAQKYVLRSQQLRTTQAAERAQIVTERVNQQHEIARLSQALLPLKIAATDVQAKFGPIKYVAALFGWNEPDVAVRAVILTIMFAFDPLAIVLLLSGSISIGEAFLPVIPELPNDLTTVATILQRSPQVLGQIIDLVIEAARAVR